MSSDREIFFRHLAQTSPAPAGLEISFAEGIYIHTPEGKKYADLISGISVSNLGHRHPAVLEGIRKQSEKYLHTMVYGEYIQSPQTALAKRLASVLPKELDRVYLVNSGSEAIEGAMKLAKRFTGKPNFISFKNAYHGSTQGALSLMSDEAMKNPFRPLLPGIKQIPFNDLSSLHEINHSTAAVMIEPVQGEAGIVIPEKDFLETLKKRCIETGTLLIFDEIQTGFGRTGKLFAFEHFGVIPDILCLGKAMGGGLPVGAFISSGNIMQTLTINPPLGHITTFGGNPLCAAAALAALEFTIQSQLVAEVEEKGLLFESILSLDKSIKIRRIGLFMALDFGYSEKTQKFIHAALGEGILMDWFLFNPESARLCPPLTITKNEIEACGAKILKAIINISS